MSKIIAVIIVVISAIITIAISSSHVGGNSVESWKKAKEDFHDNIVIILTLAAIATLIILAF